MLNSTHTMLLNEAQRVISVTHTRGFKEDEFRLISNLIADILDDLAKNGEINSLIKDATLEKVLSLCKKFPIY